MHIFIFNFQNLGLITLNLIKKENSWYTHFIDLPPPCPNLLSTTLFKWLTFFTTLLLRTQFGMTFQVLSFILLPPRFDKRGTKKQYHLLKVNKAVTQWDNNNENKNRTCSRFSCGFMDIHLFSFLLLGLVY